MNRLPKTDHLVLPNFRTEAEPVIGGRVTLRTLVLLRWVALAGQGIALLIVQTSVGLTPSLEIAFGVVMVGAVINLINALQRAGSVCLDDRDATLHLFYDIVQTSALLYLTGGIENPFSILLLTPVTVAASILSLRSTGLIGGATVTALTALTLWHLPPPWDRGWFMFPPIYVMAVWLAWTLTTLFIAGYTWSVTEGSRRLRDAYAATQLALAREQQVSAVVALAAAAAHELGSPLATITIIAKELTHDLPPDSPFIDDARLLLSEAARCRKILAELSQHGTTDGGVPFSSLPLSTLVELSGETHVRDGAELIYETEGLAHTQPLVRRSPEIIHGLGNILQNAAQFARHRVEVLTRWDASNVMVEIGDDGPGFPPQLLARLGEPYLSTRGDDGNNHMGLGVFIARSLLHRTGAVLAFSNGPNGGAFVRVGWPREALADDDPKSKSIAQFLGAR